jgi:hypothetical protein
MKTSVVKIFAGSEIRLAVLSVLILGMASACQAQASAAPAQPTTKAVASAGRGYDRSAARVETGQQTLLTCLRFCDYRHSPR